MAQSESIIVSYVPEAKTGGGRKKKTINISVVDLGDLRDADFSRELLTKTPETDGLPPLIKLSQLHNHLGTCKASVYRMTKNGLRTCRPTGPNGDQHVVREELVAFLSTRHDRKPRKKR